MPVRSRTPIKQSDREISRRVILRVQLQDRRNGRAGIAPKQTGKADG